MAHRPERAWSRVDRLRARAHTQVAAATIGLELIEELPNTSVERHYDTYRLYFDDEYIDFAQAVALEYYFFTISFGILRAGTRIPPKHRKLFLAMDRFPGAETNDAEPGEPIPPTLVFVGRVLKVAVRPQRIPFSERLLGFADDVWFSPVQAGMAPQSNRVNFRVIIKVN